MFCLGIELLEDFLKLTFSRGASEELVFIGLSFTIQTR